MTPGNFMDGTYLFRPTPMDYDSVSLSSEMTPFTPKSRQNNKFWLAKEATKYTEHLYTYSEVKNAPDAPNMASFPSHVSSKFDHLDRPMHRLPTPRARSA